MTELSPELVAALRRHARRMQVLAELFEGLAADAEEIEALLPPETATTKPRPGRPRAAPTAAQELQILRVHHANGRLGVHAIAQRVGGGVSWRGVQNVLNKYAAYQNPPPPYQKPRGADRSTGSSKSRGKGV